MAVDHRAPDFPVRQGSEPASRRILVKSLHIAKVKFQSVGGQTGGLVKFRTVGGQTGGLKVIENLKVPKVYLPQPFEIQPKTDQFLTIFINTPINIFFRRVACQTLTADRHRYLGNKLQGRAGWRQPQDVNEPVVVPGNH